MSKLPEVISTVQRRRAWSTEEKVAILDDAFRKGGSVAAAADRFGVSRALIYIWRSRVRDGQMPGVTMTDAGVSAFSAVAIVRDASPEVQSLPPSPPASTDRPCRDRRRSGAVEVRLVNGRTVKVDESIAPDVLARLVAALDTDARLRQDGGDT
jgi:transposase